MRWCSGRNPIFAKVGRCPTGWPSKLADLPFAHDGQQHFDQVLFPPFGPMSPKISPRSTCRSTPRRAWMLPR